MFQSKYERISNLPRTLDEIYGTMRFHGRNTQVDPRLQDTIRCGISTLHEFIADVLSAENNLRAPIMLLPNEILELVFRHLVHMAPPRLGHDCDRVHRGWLAALWVCQRWCAVITRDRQCWASAYTHIPWRMAPMREQARGAGLTYFLTPSTPFLSTPAHSRQTTMIQCQAAFDECRIIAVINRRDVFEHIKYLIHTSATTPLEKLEELQLHVSSTWDPNIAQQCREFASGRDMRSITAPFLRRADLNNCILPISSDHLEALHLAYTDLLLDRPSPSRLAERLLSPHSTSLTTLTLSNAIDHRAPSSTLTQKVELPRLQHLSMYGTPREIRSLLAITTFPTTTTIDIQIHDITDVDIIRGAATIAGELRLPRSINALRINATEDSSGAFYIWRLSADILTARPHNLYNLRQQPTLDIRFRLSVEGTWEWWLVAGHVAPRLHLPVYQFLVLDALAYSLPRGYTAWNAILRLVSPIGWLYPKNTVQDRLPTSPHPHDNSLYCHVDGLNSL